MSKTFLLVGWIKCKGKGRKLIVGALKLKIGGVLVLLVGGEKDNRGEKYLEKRKKIVNLPIIVLNVV